MSFAGHESFHVREGWLSKALKLVVNTPEIYLEKYPEDHLGVGRNMYKSIRYWLISTGLVEGKLARKDASQSLVPSSLAKLIYKTDPYFLSQTTWWVLHINLINNPKKSAVWSWFFNNWKLRTFEKSRCRNAFFEHVAIHHKKKPRATTLDKDLGVLMNSYGVKIPDQIGDPEDTSESPFQELALLKYFKNSNSYLLNTDVKAIPHALIGYSLWSSRLYNAKNQEEQKHIDDMTIEECAAVTGGPGACFIMNAEQLYQCIQQTSDRTIRIKGMAGKRLISVSQKTGMQWIQEAFEVEKGLAANA